MLRGAVWVRVQMAGGTANCDGDEPIAAVSGYLRTDPRRTVGFLVTGGSSDTEYFQPRDDNHTGYLGHSDQKRSGTAGKGCSQR